MVALDFDAQHLGEYVVFVVETGADAGGVDFEWWNKCVRIIATIHDLLVVVLYTFVKVDGYLWGYLGAPEVFHEVLLECIPMSDVGLYF